MNVVSTTIPEVLIFEPTVYSDSRGLFFETYREDEFQRATGVVTPFVQDNHSRSVRNVLRGLHYQVQHPQGKLVRAVVGELFDVAVDLRRYSRTFGKWVGVTLSAENKRQLWVPEGFAHGFLALSETAEAAYKATNYYAPQFERTLRWDDAEIAIEWPLSGPLLLAPKDLAGASLDGCEVFHRL